MAKELYEELHDKIERRELYLCFEGDKEDFLFELENLLENEEITEEEYESLLNKVEQTTEPICESIWNDMIMCNPDLAD